MMRDKWRQVPLSDIAEITMGNSPPSESYNTAGHGTPLINGPVEFSEDPLGSTIKSKWTTAPTKHCRQGDLLICVRGSTTGRTNVAAFDACIGRGVAAVRALEYQPFLNRFLCSRRQYIFTSGKGSTFPSISQEQLACLLIPLPPLAEQKRIAAILDAADVLRAKRRESIEQLDSLLQATFLEMFGDPVTNSHRWDLVSLGEHASKVGSGATPKGGDAAYKNEGIALIRSQNVHDGDFRLEGLAFIDDAQATKLANVEVAENDVLLNITGASVARVCRAPRHVLPARVNQHVCIIRTKPTLNAYFLEKLLLSPSMKRTLLGIGEAGATRQAITKSEVLRLALPLPPVELQARFASFVQLVESQKDRLNRHLAQLEMLFVSLQSRAFSGELCSSSSSQQPASA